MVGAEARPRSASEPTVAGRCRIFCRPVSRGHLEPESFSGVSKLTDRNDIGVGSQAQLALVLCGRNVDYILDHVAEPYLVFELLKKIGGDAMACVNDVVAVTRIKNAGVTLLQHFLDCLAKTHHASLR